MSDRRSVHQTSREITSKLISTSVIETIKSNEEVDIDFERMLLQKLLQENNINSSTEGTTNKLGRHIRLEETKIIDLELESRIQEIERKLLQSYELEEAKEERVLEEAQEREYEGDLFEDYYKSAAGHYCHEIGSSIITI